MFKLLFTLTLVVNFLFNSINVYALNSINVSENTFKINGIDKYLNIEEFENKVKQYPYRNVLKSETIALDDLDIPYVKYSFFFRDAEVGRISEVYIDENGNYEYIFFQDYLGRYHKTDNPKFDTFRKYCLEKGMSVKNIYDIYKVDYKSANEVKEEKTTTNWAEIFFIYFFVVPILGSICYVLAHYIIFRKRYKNYEKVSVGQETKTVATTDIREKEENIKKFSDIAGLTEVKEDVKTLVDFMVNRDEYCNMGAKLPKGVIFYGPPGTGKTLLAKAIAGEAGVNFLYASGSDFIEEYVGRGAKRIRELFDKAKRQAPCIIFIDEIDAICSKRGMGDGDGTSEDRKTINALLTEMDGYKELDNVLVIGATNRIEDLDPAVLRPGRFTNKYCVPLPETVEDRCAIIEIYAKNKRFFEDVDLKKLAKETIGFSPAEIECVLNEAAIIATRNKLDCINNESIDEAYNKILFKGHIRKDTSNRRKEELELVAWHEAGHAIAGLVFDKNVTKVTILSSTSGAGGATFTIPDKMGLHSINDLKQEVIGLYAGRCAEYLYYNRDWNKITTGASNDIEKATDIIYKMISVYGMTDECGMLNINRLNVKSEYIMEKASNLSNELKEEAINILENNIEVIKELVDMLLEKATVYENDLLELKKKIVK